MTNRDTTGDAPRKRRPLASSILVPILLAGGVTAGCATKTVTTGAFKETGRIETRLRRGVSQKADVRRVLGPPTGSGSAVLPIDPRPREVWYYSDIEATGMQGEGAGVVRVNVRQQVLLIFLREGVFDGFMWFTNTGLAGGE